MSRGQDYVKEKAIEALDASGGNRHEAALLLRVWAEQDQKLYRAITSPILRNLCALAVQRAIGTHVGMARKKKRAQSQDRQADLLAAIGSKQAQTMSSTRSAATAPTQGSARHKQAVTLLASSYRRKPKE